MFQKKKKLSDPDIITNKLFIYGNAERRDWVKKCIAKIGKRFLKNVLTKVK